MSASRKPRPDPAPPFPPPPPDLPFGEAEICVIANRYEWDLACDLRERLGLGRSKYRPAIEIPYYEVPALAMEKYRRAIDVELYFVMASTLEKALAAVEEDS